MHGLRGEVVRSAPVSERVTPKGLVEAFLVA
jgi:hypothetical protein